MSRYFFALVPSHTLAQALFKQALELFDDTSSLTPKNRLHLTLVFLGEMSVTQREELISQANIISHQTFELEIDRAESFEHSEVSFFTTSHTPEVLQKLSEQLRQLAKSLAIAISEKPFIPHMTIRRGLPLAEKRPLNKTIKWQVDTFYLLKCTPKSQDKGYEVIAKFN